MRSRALHFAAILLIAGCADAAPRRLDAKSPAIHAAAADLASYVRGGWHLPVRVRVRVARPAGRDAPAAATRAAIVPEPREVDLALRQIAAVREAQARAAFDFFAVDVDLGGAEAPRATVAGEDRRLAIALPAPGGDGGRIVETAGLLQALADGFEWDAVGRWYAAEPRGEVVAALRRDLAKVDRLEDELALECRRLELIAASLSERARATGQEPLLTPSETVFARGAQFRATFALHRLLNTIARWRAAGSDKKLPLRPAAQVVLARARLVHEAHLDWLLDIVVGVRPVVAVWEKSWWSRHPLYPVLDAAAPLDFVDLDGAPPGSIPAGSVRALLSLRYGGDLGDCYEAIDDLRRALDPAALAGSPLEAECRAALDRSARAEAVRAAHAFGPLRAWKETWDARLKDGFAFPFYEVIARVSIFLGDTRTTGRPPALRGERREMLAGRLRPGDILLVRQDGFLSNIFLPGFWPHAILWLGEEEAWTALKLESGARLADDPLVKAALARFRAAKDEHGNPARVIEAVSEGVVFSSIEHAMGKDYVIALRPDLPEARVAEGIRRALALHGRPYDFDFDFATDDRIVCTELVYRAYDPDLNFRVQVDAPPPGPKPPVPGVLPVVGRLTMPANEVARYVLHMQDHPESLPALRYPGRRLSVLFLVDRRGADAVVHEGAAAIAALRESVDR